MVKREYYLEKLRQLKDMNVIKVVTGVRRCGKSTTLSQFRAELRNMGISDENIISFNLEEKENKKFTKNPDALYDYIMATVDLSGRNYIFIDEVQMIPEFEKMVDSLFVKENIDLYITGSNAYMLSSDLATLLSGRYVEIKMQPLTFSEYVQFFDNKIDQEKLFAQFIRYGGFPEVANFLRAGVQQQIPLYLQSLYSTVLEKDLKKRKQIRSPEDFDNVIKYAFDNIGSITSANNISNVLRAENKETNKETVNNNLSALVDCFILYRADRYDIRGKKLLKTLDKYYAVDLGLVDVVSGRPTNADIGHRLENIVYLELLKRYGQVWIGKNYEKEIDFVVKNLDGVTEYFQVSQTVLDQDTLKREINAFENTGDNYKKTLLTLDAFDTDESGIDRVNVVDWLLSGG